MIGMAKKKARRRRAVLATALCIVLAAAALGLGYLWSLYRLYPYDWRTDIEQNAAQYGQDPLFVASVIRTESGWKPGAVSSVGAVGLMQVMPDTGKWIAGQNGWDYSDSLLPDGSYNIRLGCWYLDYLSKAFDGNQTLTLAAYNAGEHKVKQWVTEGRFKDGSLDIPYDETRRFVKKVMDSYEKYKFLYKNR